MRVEKKYKAHLLFRICKKTMEKQRIAVLGESSAAVLGPVAQQTAIQMISRW
jgi:hypothetical protein